MKKSVILIISVIYILALVFVGTSLKLAVYNPVVYVTDIEVLMKIILSIQKKIKLKIIKDILSKNGQMA